MAAITASMVAELRGKTDAPMMECKKALTEADGDMAKAEEILRVKLGSKAGKAAARVTAEGVVTSFIDGSAGALLEVNCETDFVTKNDSFLAVAQAAAELIAKKNPADVAALSRAAVFSQDGFGPTLEDVRKGLIGKIGENMSFRRFKRFDGASKLAAYLHGTRIGVLVEFEGDEVSRQGRGHARGRHEARGADQRRRAGRTDRERARGCRRPRPKRTARSPEAAGKPAQSAEILAKRIEGGVQKYLKEVSLVQPALRQERRRQAVGRAAMLKAANTSVKSFTLYVVGEGIEKKVDDFAAEVAAQVAAAKSGSLIFRIPPATPKPAKLEPFKNKEHFQMSVDPQPAHKRILLKLSGEALMGDDAFGINRATIVRMVE